MTAWKKNGEAESVRVISESTDKYPACEHGPALLFERRNNHECQRFYACSAYRDQNECPLHIRCDEMTEAMTNKRTMLLNDIAEKSKKLAKMKSMVLQKVKRDYASNRFASTLYSFPLKRPIE